MNLEKLMADPRHFVLLYGTTPPRADAPAEKIVHAATRLAGRVADLPLDGLVVYDVQDEAARVSEPRPFPFLPTLDAPTYGQILGQQTGRSVVTYKCIATESEASWSGWLDRAHEQHRVRFLSLVGMASSRDSVKSIGLPRATTIAAEHPGRFVLGGVTIAERHTPARSESLRLIAKAGQGCRYFISQAIYDATPTISLLRDYARDCADQGVEPRRIVLDFVPVGRPQTMRFMRWLGIAIPDATASAILNDPAPLSRSIAICRDLLRTILDQPYVDRIPLGLTIESVSINREEIGATIELLHTLREVAREWGLPVTA
jgi:hypothetical protein